VYCNSLDHWLFWGKYWLFCRIFLRKTWKAMFSQPKTCNFCTGQWSCSWQFKAQGLGFRDFPQVIHCYSGYSTGFAWVWQTLGMLFHCAIPCFDIMIRATLVTTIRKKTQRRRKSLSPWKIFVQSCRENSSPRTWPLVLSFKGLVAKLLLCTPFIQEKSRILECLSVDFCFLFNHQGTSRWDIIG
jgi:hypothetical protein